ncbi:MAG: hypothetical protein JXB50_11265 [Spirochaetes bacterium]|nr:hypothetical protein [Spirochaetota bacterium]
MKKINILLISLFILSINALYPAVKGRFFLENRYGVLVKVDPASAYKGNHPEKKGPRLDEIPVNFSKEEFENQLLSKINDSYDKNFLMKIYSADDDGNYKLNIDFENVIILTKIQNILFSNGIFVRDIRKIKKNYYENTVLIKLTNEEKEYFNKYYKLSNLNYIPEINWKDIENAFILRSILLKYNEKNEIYNGLETDGSPMPHKFPRVHNAKSKAHFDIHIAWGVNIKNDAIPGYLNVGFSLNITNFTMFSLEIINIKYNFELSDHPFEPYLGFTIYGGYLDGFPIGFNFFGGVQVYPLSIHLDSIDKNRTLFATGELRLGPVIYIPLYYDTGLNTETIYKKIGILMDGGFYTSIGYIF